MAEGEERWTIYGRGDHAYPIAKGQTLPMNFPLEVVRASRFEEVQAERDRQKSDCLRWSIRARRAEADLERAQEALERLATSEEANPQARRIAEAALAEARERGTE